MPHKDFKIDKVFYVEVQSESPVLTHPAVLHAFEIFMKNMHGVFSLGATPPLFVAYTSLYQDVEFKALHKLGLPPDAERTIEVKKEAYKLLCDETKSPNYQAQMHEWGLGNLKALMGFYPMHFDEGIEAILWAMVTGSWTAFEVLCEDLLDCAAIAWPSHFAGMRGKNRGLRSLATIRETFNTYLQDEAVNAVLCDPHLESLSVFRNVKVHKAGIADCAFIERIMHLSTVVKLPDRGLKENDKIEIDGDMVRSFIGAAIKPGEALAKSIDNWILSHPVDVNTTDSEEQTSGQENNQNRGAGVRYQIPQIQIPPYRLDRWLEDINELGPILCASENAGINEILLHCRSRHKVEKRARAIALLLNSAFLFVILHASDLESKGYVARNEKGYKVHACVSMALYWWYVGIQWDRLEKGETIQDPELDLFLQMVRAYDWKCS